jgi:hypothetical protein
VADGNILNKEYSNQPPHAAALVTTLYVFKVQALVRREEKSYSRWASASRAFQENFKKFFVALRSMTFTALSVGVSGGDSALKKIKKIREIKARR